MNRLNRIKTMRVLALLVVITLCGVMFAGCTFSINFAGNRRIKLEDKYITETTMLKEDVESWKIVIDQLVLANSDVYIRVLPSDTPRVEALFSQDLKNYGFKVTEDNGVVTISTGHNYTYSTDRFELTIYANFHELQLNGGYPLDVDAEGMQEVKLSINGASNCKVTNLAAERVEVSIKGAAAMELLGYTDALDVEISGAGTIDARYLACSAARVDLAGAGNVDVSVSDLLEVDINGLGVVDYYGSPVVKRDIDGLGSIDQKSGSMLAGGGYI